MGYYARTSQAKAKVDAKNKRRRVFLTGGALLFLLAIAALVVWGTGRYPWKHPQTVIPPDSQAPAVQSQEFNLVASGDVMLGRRVAAAMKEKGNFYPFTRMAPLLQDADLTFGNLECALSTQGTPLQGKGIWFRGDPGAAAALKEAGYQVISLANNHSLDFDDPALLETLAVLKEQGIAPVGGGADSSEALQPVIKEVNGSKVAFLAATEMADIFWSWETRRTLEAKADRPGVARLDGAQMADAIRALKGKADLIVVSLHWGVEYEDEPTAEQRELAHSLADAGANLIIGTHPHCLQGVEVYNGSLITYSLGNFVYDKQTRPKSQEGLLMKVFFRGPVIQKAVFYPYLIQQEQPGIVHGSDAERILRRTAALSEKLGTPLMIHDEVGLVSVPEVH